LGEVEVCYHVAVVTVVGRRIRERLPDLGKAMSAFEGMQVLMVSASSEDVAMSFVVHEEKAQLLTEVLHHHLIPVHGGDEVDPSVFLSLLVTSALSDVWPDLEGDQGQGSGSPAIAG